MSLDARQRFEPYLAQIGTFLWDCRQRASFATYTLGLLSELPRKSVESIRRALHPGPRRHRRSAPAPSALSMRCALAGTP